MFKEGTANQTDISLQPLERGSKLSDAFIRVREPVLNRLAGANDKMVINLAEGGSAMATPADLAARLKQTLTDLRASVIDKSGGHVDYAALRANPAYAEYQAECLVALHHFQPQGLPTEDARRAFWINLYNALVLDAVITFGVKESVSEGFLGIFSFFRRAAYLVDGRRVSLEDIEHGLLRGNRGNPFVPGPHFGSGDPRLQWALPLDSRIHFALNCGGRSCPPIRAYSPEQLDEQLDLAARSFVGATVETRPRCNQVLLSQIFNWYKKDFGGRKGVLNFLLRHLPEDERRAYLVSAQDRVSLKFNPYDWGLNAL